MAAAKAFTSAAGIFGHGKVLETVHIVNSLTKEIVTLGTGSERPSSGANVKAHYVGKLLSGADFDSSRKRGRPFTL
jgi:FKBP-type peptidyl-prolyl cis-trans isomerase